MTYGYSRELYKKAQFVKNKEVDLSIFLKFSLYKENFKKNYRKEPTFIITTNKVFLQLEKQLSTYSLKINKENDTLKNHVEDELIYKGNIDNMEIFIDNYILIDNAFLLGILLIPLKQFYD